MFKDFAINENKNITSQIAHCIKNRAERELYSIEWIYKKRKRFKKSIT